MTAQTRSEPRCLCCDLPISSCGRLLETRQRQEAEAERRRLLNQPGWITATYPALCLRCGDRYPAGTPIHRFAQGWACCGEDAMR